MTYPHNAKLYRTTPDFTLAQYTYKRHEDGKHTLEDSNRVSVHVSDEQLSSFNFSRKMALTELEETLRIKLERIHSEMKQMAVEFNPTDKGFVVDIRNVTSIKTVHKYCKKSGRYLESYPAVREAARILGKADNPNSISMACNGKAKTSYGFKWSYEKRNFY